MLSPFNTPRFALTLALKAFFSHPLDPHKHDILKSQFHLQGHRHFQKSKLLSRIMDSSVVEIQRTQVALQKKRSVVLQKVSSEGEVGQQSESMRHYFQSYLKLLQLVKESKYSDDWIYRIAGWYNIQHMLQTMVDKMLTKSGKNQHLALIESISWMQPHTLVLNAEDQQESVRIKRVMEGYYKQLILSHQIKILQQIESILGKIGTESKSKYFQAYMNIHLKQLIRVMNPLNEQEMEKLFWLFETYVSSYNDSPLIIEEMEKYVLGEGANSIKQKQIDILLSIYNKLGRINMQIYNKHLKPYLLRLPCEDILAPINLLEFVINSQANDSELLDLAFQNIVALSKKSNIPDIYRLRIHYIIQYLNIKKIPYRFSIILPKEYNELCRRYGGNSNIARNMAISLDDKARKEGVSFYNSECLRKGRQSLEKFQQEKEEKQERQETTEQIKKVPGFKKHNNVRFCCIDIDMCVTNDAGGNAVILQRNFMKFAYSGKMMRQVQVRDEILKNYGFKINYVQPKKIISKPQTKEVK